LDQAHHHQARHHLAHHHLAHHHQRQKREERTMMVMMGTAMRLVRLEHPQEPIHALTEMLWM
jgi:hypothetical protein